MAENSGDIALGEKGALRKPVVEAFKNKGIKVAKATISELRSGRENGEVIRNRVLCAEKLAKNDASLKNNLYLTIINHALELRTPQQRYAHRFDTNRYMEALSEQLSKDQHDVSRLIQAMRADLVFTNPDETSQDLVNTFKGLAEKFIKDYTGPYPSSAHQPIRSLDINWDHTTIRNYYQALNTQGVRFVTTWVPYEMEVMAKFYQSQILQGNHLTSFDRTVLETILDSHISDEDAAQQIRLRTGMRVGHPVIQFHRNSLVYGTTASALRTRKA